MDTVGYNFHSHVVHEVNAFHSAFVFVFTAFVESGHCIIEMCSMCVSGFIGCTYVLKFGLCMGYRSQNTFSGDIFSELHGSG